MQCNIMFDMGLGYFTLNKAIKCISYRLSTPRLKFLSVWRPLEEGASTAQVLRAAVAGRQPGASSGKKGGGGTASDPPTRAAQTAAACMTVDSAARNILGATAMEAEGTVPTTTGSTAAVTGEGGPTAAGFRPKAGSGRIHPLKSKRKLCANFIFPFLLSQYRQIKYVFSFLSNLMSKKKPKSIAIPILTEVWKQNCLLNSHGSLLNVEQEAPLLKKKNLISYNNPDLIVFFTNPNTILIVHGCLNCSVVNVYYFATIPKNECTVGPPLRTQ
jgi:hypothetical protein